LLVVAGANRERARFPAEGTLSNRNQPVDLRWQSSTKGGWNRPLTHEERTRMLVEPGDIPAGMDLPNAEITVYHQWDESTVRVKSYDPNSGLVEFLTETEHPPGAFKSQRYTVWNTREGMTRPGQWYFDRASGEVVYWPEQGEEPAALDAWTAVAEHAILCHGCRNVEIRGFQIRFCSAPAQAVGLRAIQAPGAVEARDVQSIQFRHLTIAHVSGHGLKLWACKDATIDHCRISEAGAGGIFSHACENETITRNAITGIGRMSFSAIGIHCGWRSMLVYVQDKYPEERGMVLCAHNTIEDVPYCGITCNGGPHRIEYNRLANCMTVLHDGAAIYCSRGDRTVIRGNLVRDIDCDLAYAYYFDEQSRHCVLDGNIAVNVPTPVLCHMSEDLFFSRNVFLSDQGCRINLALSRYTLWRHNIMVCAGKLEFAYRSRPAYQKASGPLSEAFSFVQCIGFSRSGEVELMLHNHLPPDGSLLAIDPKLEVAKDGSLVLADDSPLRDTGYPLPDGRLAGADLVTGAPVSLGTGNSTTTD
jgi:hypothetical protein